MQTLDRSATTTQSDLLLNFWRKRNNNKINSFNYVMIITVRIICQELTLNNFFNPSTKKVLLFKFLLKRPYWTQINNIT
jgi:hypothetical protein